MRTKIFFAILSCVLLIVNCGYSQSWWNKAGKATRETIDRGREKTASTWRNTQPQRQKAWETTKKTTHETINSTKDNWKKSAPQRQKDWQDVKQNSKQAYDYSKHSAKDFGQGWKSGATKKK